jgi:hypothetical protein
MNFNFDCEKLLGSESDGIAIIEPSYKQFLKLDNFICISQILDSLGGFSASVNFLLNKE